MSLKDILARYWNGFQPVLFAVGLELGKDAEHVEERLAGSGRGVHGLFGSGKMGTLVLSVATMT